MMYRRKPYQSFTAVAAQLLLPLTLLLIAGALYFVMKSGADQEREHPASLSETFPQLNTADEDLFAPLRLTAQTEPFYRLTSDTEILSARVNSFAEMMLSSVYTTGRELRDVGAFLEAVQKCQPEKVEIQRTLNGLRSAVEAGAVDAMPGKVTDMRRLQGELGFRTKHLFPFYGEMVGELTVDIRTLQETLQSGIRALEDVQQIWPLVPGWEEQTERLSETLRDANYKMTETRNLLRAVCQSPSETDSLLGEPVEDKQIEHAFLQSRERLTQTDQAQALLVRNILKVIPEPAQACSRINAARSSVRSTALLLEFSRIVASAVPHAVTSYRLYADQLSPKPSLASDTMLLPERLLTVNRKMVADCRILCNTLGNVQTTRLLTLPEQFNAVLHTLNTFEANRQRAQRRLEYLRDAVAAYKSGKGFLPQPDSVRFLVPSRRSAVVTVSVYDAVSGAPLPEISVYVAGIPGLKVKNSQDGHYRFALRSSGSYTVSASGEGYESATAELQTGDAKNYALTLRLMRLSKPEMTLYGFLEPGTDIDARINGERIFMQKLLEKYAKDVHITHEIMTRSENRMQLLRSGLEPGAYTLPEGVEP